MQPAKPSFLEYFEQKEKEANVQNNGGARRENNADKLLPDGDLQVVSLKHWSHHAIKENVLLNERRQ